MDSGSINQRLENVSEQNFIFFNGGTIKSQMDRYQVLLLIVLLIEALRPLYDRSRYTHQTVGAELPRNNGWQAPFRVGR